MENNLVLDSVLQQQIENGTLGYIGIARVAAGRVAASLFPEATVYLSPQQQGTETPAFFLGVSNVQRGRRLGGEFLMQISFEFLYLPGDALSETERLDTAERLMSGLARFDSEIGELRCPELLYQNTDTEFKVTGTIQIEATDPDWDDRGELIQNASRSIVREN